MNQEENDLFERLCAVKNYLQERFFDYEAGRRPTICTIDALKLLVKYKPKTLEDMENISGIGKNFIENYGKYFLTEILNFEHVNKIPITDDEKVILSKLENRLVNINKRNRLLYSSKVNKDYGLDIVKFLNNAEELEKFIIARDTKSFNIMNADNFEDDKLKTILKLKRQVSKIEVESGNNELYIAYPFVQGKMENENFLIKAPLILFPVNIERISDRIILKNDFSRDILYNTTLILANNKFNGKNEVLPDNAIEEFNSENYLSEMLKFYENNNFYIQNNPGELEKFLENRVNEFPSYPNGQLEIKKYMVLGLYSTYVTSMYEDFHKMIQENSVPKLIKELLWGMENVLDNQEALYDENNEKGEDLKHMEDEINYINELDFSQEKVLKEINATDSIVVQGPPGTGKSQTITSIIAQCILKGQNVLMVSEKKTALDVIYSRLGNLSQFAILIDDVENKQTFYDQLNRIISNLNDINNENIYNQDEIIMQIKNKIKIIDDNLDHLDTIAQKIYEINDFGTSMYNIYQVCPKINLTNPEEYEKYNLINQALTDLIKQLNYPILTSIKDLFNEENTIKSINDYLEIIKNNSLINNIKLNLIDYDIIELTKKINDLEIFLKEISSLPLYKKIFMKRKLKEKINDIANNYFINNNKVLAKQLVTSLDFLKNFLPNYVNFINNKFLYDKLDYNQKEYVNIIEEVKKSLNISFKEANEAIYNTILFNVISNFEKNNFYVTSYINNFHNIREDIRKNIVEKMQLTKNLTFMRLLTSAYNLDGNNKLSKIEEMCNRKRKMAINKFMMKYKLEMLDSIKVWLMTPEVVSDILPLNNNIFDLVIFDEASQLYVEKSIPAIYRAKKVVVAGDQKQLKPSSLGKGRILDEIDEEEVADGFLEYESLLDAARYKYKHTMLNYHYRSKYTELIAFSNYAFYGGKLMVTSLAQNSCAKPIERIKIPDGLWIDKKNVKEAEAVIKLVKKILNTRKNNETIGVITFNASQMNLIEDLIEKEKAQDEAFATQMLAEENRFLNGENISFFVKNIESVQGDERDIIIFCIGYAKNETGRVAINFGWLNQDGGENRLNVAISRAKEKIYVVTSIEPEELIVEDTKNNGPKLFKQYLEYVKALSDGNKELAKAQLLALLDKNDEESKQLTFDSDFEEEVCNKLIAQGYKVETQYGVGGYRIDIVIKSPDGQNNLLGIECDGRLYHSSKFSRERDYHRQKYLESRGWKIYRIWSSNWWKNPELEITKINNYLKHLTFNNNE